MNRIFSPSPTVRASSVPNYQLGFLLLGDDGSGDVIDWTGAGDSGPNLPDPIDMGPIAAPDLGPIAIAPPSPLFSAPKIPMPDVVATGTLTPAQAASAAAAMLAQSMGQPKAPNLPPGPSPRVASRPPSASTSAAASSATLIPGVPNIALMIGGGLLLFAAMGRR